MDEVKRKIQGTKRIKNWYSSAADFPIWRSVSGHALRGGKFVR
jgi:hypothetical protein